MGQYADDVWSRHFTVLGHGSSTENALASVYCAMFFSGGSAGSLSIIDRLIGIEQYQKLVLKPALDRIESKIDQFLAE